MNNPTPSKRIVVLGLGNLILGDDGLGVHAVNTVSERLAGQDVSCLDGGTLGLSLLPYMEDATHVLILDAIGTDSPPGSLIELSPAAMHAFPALKFSVHDVSLPDLLSLLELRMGPKAPEVYVLGSVPFSLEPSDTLSPTVAATLPQVVDRAVEIVEGWL